MRGRQIPLGGRVAARPARPAQRGPDPLAARGWREVRAAGAVHTPPRLKLPLKRPTPARQLAQPAQHGRPTRPSTVIRQLRRAFAALLLLGVAALAVWAATTPDLRVRQVRVEGTTDAALIASLRALPVGGCFVLLCDTRAAGARAEALPQVASARAWLDPPSTLVLRVTPRAPVLVWRAGDVAVLVGGDGVVIGPAATADLARLPVVSDPISAALPGGKAAPGAKLAPHLVELAAQLRSALPALLGASVSLRYDPVLGLVADDGHGLQVVFGDPSRPPADLPLGAAGQLDELRAILHSLAQAGQRANWIDLRWGLHPAYRLA